MEFNSRLLRKAEKHISRLQRNAYKALMDGNQRKFDKFQKLIVKSYYGRILALYRVAKLNKGKKTAGVDGIKIKLTDKKSVDKVLRKARRIVQGYEEWEHAPIKRVNIPKPNGKLRPLGIPTQFDRVMQAIVNNVLFVIQEYQIAKHELKTFGFRKGFKTADAIKSLSPYANLGKHGRIIEADIEQCFDKIDHEKIIDVLTKYGIIEQVKQMVKGCLKANILIGDVFHRNEMGTPQGGILSPTLANIVLREHLDIPFEQEMRKIKAKAGISLLTYADDIVIVQGSQGKEEKLEMVKQSVSKLLSEIGLNLKEEKTRIITDDKPFNFLGFEIQRGKGIRLNPEMIKRTRRKVKNSLKRGRNRNKVVKEVNAIMRGVYNYAGNFSSGKMWKQLGKIHFDIGNRMFKLYKDYGKDIVTFADVTKTISYEPPQRPTTLEDKEYWDKRSLTNFPDRKRAKHRFQKGICPICKGSLGYDPTLLQVHHLLEKSKSGKDTNRNTILVHQVCHEAHHKL